VTGLARCVGEVTPFLRDHWGRTPFHLPGADGAAFTDLLSLAGVDHLIASTFLRVPALRLVRDGTPLDPSEYTRTSRLGSRPLTDVVHPGRVYERFRTGATIVLQGLQRYWPPLTDLARRLEVELTHPVQVNAYVTPPSARGLAVHYDTHDVFVLQFAGSKGWAVHQPVFEDPLPSQPWSERRGTPGPPELEVTLEAGDSLYVPRGFLHSARAQDGISGHLTVGVVTTNWADVLRAAVDGIDDEVGFRRALPPGWADDDESARADLTAAVSDQLERLRGWLEKVDAGAVATTVARRFWAGRIPPLEGQLAQLAALDRIDDSTTVRRRAGAICVLEAVDGRLEMVLGDRVLLLPAELEEAVRILVGGGADPIRVGDLAAHLDGPSRQVLVRRLVREGLLEAVEDG
jgi:bifunctional lysine-specific demethylase and histidyl-hydroxylase NO66